MYEFARWSKAKITELNIFENEASLTNPFHLRSSIIATRIYLFLFTLVITILILITALATKTHTVMIDNVSLENYEKLLKQYPTSLSCPCRQAAISYGTFASITVDYHVVCSSVFVSKAWINHVFSPNLSYFSPIDFRSLASGYFQILATLCSSAMRIVNDTIADFMADMLLTTEALDTQSLDARIQARSKYSQTLASKNIRRDLLLARSSIHDNNFLSALQTSNINLMINFYDVYVMVAPGETHYIDRDGQRCVCDRQSTCFTQCGFFDIFAVDTAGDYTPITPSRANVTGFFAGCFAIESLLQSTLECFFDQICLHNILNFFPNASFFINPLKSLNDSQFSPQSTIQTLVNELFIERWSTVSSFAKYFSYCAPISCTYFYSDGDSALVILTTLLGLYGGLTVALRLAVFHSVSFYRNRRLPKTKLNNHADDSVTGRLQFAWNLIRVRIREFNLFGSAAMYEDRFQLRSFIIATRVYLILLGCSISILFVYTILGVRIQTNTVVQPNRGTFENLYISYASTLQCPCNQIIIPYSSFIVLSPKYHPVCSSLYVSETWLTWISYEKGDNRTRFYQDFRIAGVDFFNMLRSFCSQVQLTMDEAIYIFNRSTLISDQVLPKVEFEARTLTILNQFKSDTVSLFYRAITLNKIYFRTMFPTYQTKTVMAAIDTMLSSSPIEFRPYSMTQDYCSCALNESCPETISILSYGYPEETNISFVIPHVFLDCFVSQAVLGSTLECFFDVTCLNKMKLGIVLNSSITLPILPVNGTRFLPNTSIDTILGEMVEEWGEHIDYSQYYKQCSPKLCSYTFLIRNDAIYALTTLIALLGGLSVALRFIVPTLVHWIRQRLKANNNTVQLERPPMMIVDRIRLKRDWLISQMRELNMFENEATMHAVHIRRQQIISTRIYLTLLVCSVLILIVSTLSSTVTERITIENPSEQVFEQLQSHTEYSATLKCSCKNIIVLHDSIATIRPRIHQLCSSDFINTLKWISSFYDSFAVFAFPYDDFHLFAVPQFRLLASLCSLANSTLMDELKIFKAKTFVSIQAQSRYTLTTQINASLNHFRLSAPRVFVRTFDFIRQMAQGNQIVSNLMSNWNFRPLHNVDRAVLWAEPRSYGNETCSCGTTAMCHSAAMFGDWVVPGFRVGCHPLEALLQSTLECLYDVACIHRIGTMYTSQNPIVFPLNPNISSPNDTVQSLIETLFVDQWESDVNYENYYSNCAPTSCTYLRTERANPVYAITTIAGLYGGLTIVLKLIAPFFAEISQAIINYRRRRIGTIPVVDTTF